MRSSRTSTTTLDSPLKELTDFSVLANPRILNELHQTLHVGRRYVLEKHQIVQNSDDRFRSLVNLVQEGYIKRYAINNDGSLAIQAIYGPGDIFPLTLVYRALFDMELYEGPEIIYYETITDAVIYSYDSVDLKEAAQNDPKLYRDILIEVGIRTISNIQRLENISLKNALKRLAHQLVFLASQFGDDGISSVRLKPPLTHQDLADILSLTRETVSLNMRKLQRKGLIKMSRSIEVLNLPELKKLAYS